MKTLPNKILAVTVYMMLLLPLIMLASCSNVTNKPAQIAEKTIAERILALKPNEVRMSVHPDTVPEELGVRLEFVKYAKQTLHLIIRNDSGYDVEYGDGYSITIRQWGSMGKADEESFILSSGKYREINLSFGSELGFGEGRITIDITVDPESPDAKEYLLHADFAIENTAIPRNVRGIVMEVDFEAPIGASLVITNGFKSGRIFFDKSFLLERNTDGTWENIPIKCTDIFPADEIYSLASRQVLSLTQYWAWLYGELPPGEYRIGKSFWHVNKKGECLQYDLQVIFSLDGEPIPDSINRDGSDWLHPFSNIDTFRAEVTGLFGPHFFDVAPGHIGLLVRGLAPIWGNDNWIDASYYVWDNLTIAVLNTSHKQIPFSDIPQGAIVDITFGGVVLTSDPAHVTGAHLIQIIDP